MKTTAYYRCWRLDGPIGLANDEVRMTNGKWQGDASLFADSFNSPGFAADDDGRGHRAARGWHFLRPLAADTFPSLPA